YASGIPELKACPQNFLLDNFLKKGMSWTSCSNSIAISEN
ncbi:20444_t:CDS:1, partial [Dentiscutata erythropus]